MTWHYANGLEAFRDPSAKDLRQKPRRNCLKSVWEDAMPLGLTGLVLTFLSVQDS